MSRRAAPRRGTIGAAGISAPADRRFRRPDTRPERRRLLRVTWRIARWGVPTLIVAGLTVWLAGVLLRSEWMRVQHIVVRGNMRLSTAEVEERLAGLRRENILRVTLDGYQQRLLESSAWIERATFARVLPATIDVTIVERTPVAIARIDRQLVLVDGTGVILDDYGAADHLDLPIVDGLVAGRTNRVDPDRIRATRGLLEALGTRPDLAQRVSQINASNARDLVVMLDDDTVWLHLGTERFVERLTTYLDLGPRLDERFGTIESVDLRFDSRVFVQGQELGQGRRF